MSKAEQNFIEYMETNDMPDRFSVIETEEKAVEQLCSMTGQAKEDIEDILSYTGYEREKQGFINGFQYAMQIMFSRELAVAG